MQDLTVNPLLLTKIAMVHRYRGALPGKRIELYKEMCEVLLGRWRQSSQKRLVLAWMMERGNREMRTDDVLAIKKPLLRKVGVTGDAQKAFLVELHNSRGLLLDREEGVWRFAHLTFQEYLTAAYGVAEKCAPADWRMCVGDSWWHETLRLYAAQRDATPILQACLVANDVTALTLAGEITEDGALLMSEEVKTAVRERLEDALTSADPASRRLAAEVKLTQRLKSFRRLNDISEVDNSLVTCAEYQLFLDERRAAEHYHQPKHWVELQHSMQQAKKPVFGVMAADAEAFCEWLNQAQGGKMRYRLPSVDEVKQIDWNDLEQTFWVSSSPCIRLNIFLGNHQPNYPRLVQEMNQSRNYIRLLRLGLLYQRPRS